jgi:hypothetical protein
MAMQTTPAMSCIQGSMVDEATLGAAVASAAVEAAPGSEAELSGWLAEAIFPPPKVPILDELV